MMVYKCLFVGRIKSKMNVIKPLPSIRLQPLRIYPGWTIKYNKFMDLDPQTVGPDDAWFYVFTQDLLQMEQGNILLDLSWYPEGDPNGRYGLELIKNDDWEAPLVDYSSRKKEEIAHYIEKWTWEVDQGRFR
ncbi:hypothetical protein [Desmospora profundinema]|uniref:Uncharacterized protein n=1 Tax=Desmospora profundinema TaxID=1571184 RepID=A0ABU1IL25_9BACL|nr:hypothetical protein [Desmospora profundinema]MDR6225476.1 hypothetical protein [Desmospora profundinema]